ncbi:MAG: DUF4129 domain-containing protein, partial [Anaerolineae bacterium]|nr:DUF4129 domain-containing protein [Anaerolineae bacterium]
SLLILWLVTFIFNPEMRKRMLGRLLLYTAILLTIYVLYGHFQKLELDNQANGDDVEIGLGGSFLQEQPPLPPLVANPPPWLVNVITLAIIALALAAGWWVWQRYLRRQHQPDLAILLAQKARHAVKNLEAGSDLKDTVLRCYRDMSQVLYEQRGIQRQQGMTPREFEAHLAEIGLRDHHIQRLTRLFESVRYGDNTASEREKREARDCLNAIVRVYGRLA